MGLRGFIGAANQPHPNTTMRLSTLFVATCVFAAGAVPAAAQSASSKVQGPIEKSIVSPKTSPVALSPFSARGAIFSEDFESSTDASTPTGWFVENTNNDSGDNGPLQWSTIAQPTRAHTGNNAAAVFWNPAQAANDWMISPGFALEANTTYRISTWFKAGDTGFGTSESMEIAIGMGQTVAAMTTIVEDLNNVPAGDYIEVLSDFTPTASGTYNLGYHCNSAADQYFCAVDDITVFVPTSGPQATPSASAVDFGAVLVGESVAETVTITNSGASDLNISGTVGSGDGFVFDFSNTATTIAAGESTTFTVAFEPTASVAYTGSAVISSDDPDSPLTISFDGMGASAPANDNIADATPISEDGTYTGTNAFASLETDEPVPSCQTLQGASIFWAYTPGSDGTVTIDLSASDFDTVLTFHQADGTEIACNDDGGASLTSLLSDVPVTAGTTYLIRVAGFAISAAATGSVSFDLALTPVVANESSPDAEFALTAPQPNPASGVAQVSLKVETSQSVSVVVYDLLGRAVATLHKGLLSSGSGDHVHGEHEQPSGRPVRDPRAGRDVRFHTAPHGRSLERPRRTRGLGRSEPRPPCEAGASLWSAIGESVNATTHRSKR